MPEQEQRFFVAVIGGLWNLEPMLAEQAAEAGRILGQELARASFGLIVYFSNPESLEPHVVKGFAAATPSEQKESLIRIRYPTSLRNNIRFAEQDIRPELFDHQPFPSDEWEVPFYQSLSENEGPDAVVLLAGAISTLIAGQIAVARQLPILPIDSFGGSAAKVWSQLAYASPRKRIDSWGTRPAADLVKQLREECLIVWRARAEMQRGRKQLISILEKRNQTLYAAGAVVPLVATLGYGTAGLTAPGYYTLVVLAGLVSAGSVGASVRTILAEQGTADPRTSLLLGGIAGLVVGLAYLIPQWVGAPGPLRADGTAISSTDRLQFVSSVIVALSAGIGFDTIFNRLRKQAHDSRIGPA